MVTLNMDSSLDPQAAERLAALLSLPLRSEPETDAERAMFEAAERAVASGDFGILREDTQHFLARPDDPGDDLEDPLG